MFQRFAKNSNQKLVYIFIGVISALVTVIISTALLPFKPYRTRITYIQTKNPQSAIYYTYYKDLNNDGQKEKIVFNRIVQFKSNRDIKIYNSKNQLIFKRELKEPWIYDGWRTGDFDGDSLKEIYIFSRKRFSSKHDSIFLFVFNPFGQQKVLINRANIVNTDDIENNPHGVWIPNIKIIGLWDVDGDGSKELIFYIFSNLGWEPRNIYAFSIKKKKIVAKSPYLINIVDFAKPEDVDGDGEIEFYPYLIRFSPFNKEPVIDSLSCDKLYFFVLNKHLQFKVKPTDLNLYKGRIKIKYLKERGKGKFLLSHDENSGTRFSIIDLKGKILKNKFYAERLRPILANDETFQYIPDQLYYQSESGIFKLFPDLSKKMIFKKDSPSWGKIFLMNIDADPNFEILRFKTGPSGGRILTIYRHDFSSPIKINIPNKRDYHMIVSVKNRMPKKSKINISTERVDTEFTYGHNPYLYLNIIFVTVIFGSIYLILYVVFLLINTLYFYYHFLARHLNTINKGTLLLSFQGKVLHYNQNFLKMLNLPNSIKAGINYTTLFRSQPQILNFVERLMNGKSELFEDLTFRKNGGSTFKGRLYGYYLTGISGIHSGYCVEVYDMSESILTEREEVITRLIRKMAHDIKTPLSTIKFSIETMRYTLPKKELEKVSEDIDTMSEEINHIHSITENYSKFARLSRLNLQVVSLREMIGRVLSKYDLPKTVIVKVDISDDADMITADGRQLELLIKEVFENALDAIVDKGEIKFEASLANFVNEAHSEAIRLRISDNGKGIAKEIKDRIFEPSFSTKDQGTGFGLVLVQRIVQSHNGQILFDSEEGKGTQVQIILPKDAVQDI